MIRIGLISAHPTKPEKRFFGQYTKEFILNKKNPFELLAVTVPYSGCQFGKLRDSRKNRVINKAKAIMEKNGVERVFFSPSLRCVPDAEADKCSAKDVLFPRWAYVCVRLFSKRYGIDLLQSKVCIRHCRMDRISEQFISQLRFDTKNLAVCTNDFGGAQAIREKFLEETGMAVKIADYDAWRDFDVVIDVDGAAVRIGRDLVVDGAVADFELGGYDADLTEITAHVAQFVTFDRNLNFFSDKKKLTL
ncbi:MAG: hypothetical protein IJN96_06495 [Clostridia bacterium]|nr:hypothetical protein [Clostridia bacterium]